MGGPNDDRVEEEVAVLVRAFFGAPTALWMPAEALQAALPRLRDAAAAVVEWGAAQRGDDSGGSR